jgi:hypothetical protein
MRPWQVLRSKEHADTDNQVIELLDRTDMLQSKWTIKYSATNNQAKLKIQTRDSNKSYQWTYEMDKTCNMHLTPNQWKTHVQAYMAD